MKKNILTAILGCALLFPVQALACACCAEPGEYRITTMKPGELQISALKELRFEEAANLFTTAAGFDGIKGLKPIEKDYDSHDWTAASDFFGLTGTFIANTWKFNFKTKTGQTGVISLPLPTRMVSFKADIHDTPAGSEISLYKEWRFKGVVQSGSGFFAAGILRPTTYFLVLQGRGNNCDNAAEFTNWRLEVTGKNADYAFFGKLK